MKGLLASMVVIASVAGPAHAGDGDQAGDPDDLDDDGGGGDRGDGSPIVSPYSGMFSPLAEVVDDLVTPVMVLVVVSEWLIPDVRYEFGDDHGWVLSFPVQLVQASALGWSHLSLFVEPQLRVSGEDRWRLVGGGRVGLYPVWGHGLGLIGEAGGVLGEDGNGYLIGGGLALTLDASDAVLDGRRRPRWTFPSLALVARRTWTDAAVADRRWDLSLDVVWSTAFDLAARL